MDRTVNFYEYLVYNLNNDEDTIDVYTISYKDTKMLEIFIKLLKKYFIDKFILTVIEVTPSEDINNITKKLCKIHKCNYLKIKTNPLPLDKKIGIKMNWVYENIVKQNKYKYFGFLQTDMLLTRMLTIKDKIEQMNMCGRCIHNDYYTKIDVVKYLWEGYCFFKKSALVNGFDYSGNIRTAYFDPTYIEGECGARMGKMYKIIQDMSCSITKINYSALNNNILSRLEQDFHSSGIFPHYFLELYDIGGFWHIGAGSEWHYQYDKLKSRKEVIFDIIKTKYL
jgi:hypothetical protein